MHDPLYVADLFCGLGGLSHGLSQAAEQIGRKVELVAVNHWPLAIETHKANHPDATHFCESLELLSPRQCVPGGHLDLLIAAPSCVHHSNARGGRPMNEQDRASAWCIMRWVTELAVDRILIENVPEFQSWGPLGADGRPIKKFKGKTFLAFVNGLREIGYDLQYRVLNCADYGDPTTRKRFFLMASRVGSVAWPDQSHCDPIKLASDQLGLTRNLKPWIPAREIIDWSLEGKSIFDRKKPLAKKTLDRIYAGLQKFGGPNAEPFLIILRQHMDAQSVDAPIPTLSAGGNHVGLAQPVLVNIDHRSSADLGYSVDNPLSTVTTKARSAVVEPFILPHEIFGLNDADSIDEPLRTVRGNGRQNGIVEPFILPHEKFDLTDADSIHSPLRTITANNGKDNRLVEPIIVPNFGERDGQEPRAHSLDAPLPAVTGHGAGALAEAVLVDIAHGNGQESPETAAKRRSQSVSGPIGTITGSPGKALAEPILLPHPRTSEPEKADSIDAPLRTVTAQSCDMALAEPVIVEYYGSSDATPIGSPVPTVTTKDRFALVMPDGTKYRLDIRLRMLRPHELAAAHSLKGYTLKGTLEGQVKMIGNSVPASTGRALCEAALFDCRVSQEIAA